MLRRSSSYAFVCCLIVGGAILYPCPLWGQSVSASTQATAVPAANPTLTLHEAIRLAEGNEPVFASALASARVNALLRKDARAALLPTATYHNQVIYTQPNGQSNRIGQTINQPTPIFIANNAVREYASQGVFNETIGFSQIAAIRQADANAAIATAELEIARRGLVATVVSLFYNVGAQANKVTVATRALSEANRFVEITRQREAAREAAHADVVKAQIQQQQRERDVTEAQLAADKAHLELGVLLFPDPGSAYSLTPPDAPPPLPDRATVETAARANNPELRSALASLHATEADTYAARAALLPQLGVNVTYGIDAPQFAVNGPEQVRNLGYAGSATLDLPVWDWLTSERKIKESRILQGAAKTGVTAAQRRLIADLSELYSEAATAQTELASLDASVLAARESLHLTNLRYTDGEATVFEVVDAQNTLVLSETAQLDGMVRYQLALAQLQTLTGSL